VVIPSEKVEPSIFKPVIRHSERALKVEGVSLDKRHFLFESVSESSSPESSLFLTKSPEMTLSRPAGSPAARLRGKGCTSFLQHVFPGEMRLLMLDFLDERGEWTESSDHMSWFRT
jgi:hypothetical protein